jgi:hypothetical protein
VLIKRPTGVPHKIWNMIIHNIPGKLRELAIEQAIIIEKNGGYKTVKKQKNNQCYEKVELSIKEKKKKDRKDWVLRQREIDRKGLLLVLNNDLGGGCLTTTGGTCPF